MAARNTTATGKIKVNLALTAEAYELLRRLSRHQRAQGELISQLILAEAERRDDDDLASRVGALEAQVAALLSGQQPPSQASLALDPPQGNGL